MEDYLSLWGIPPHLRKVNFQKLLDGNNKIINILEELIQTYPNRSNNRLFLTKRIEIMEVMGNFAKQLLEAHQSKIRSYFVFKNLSEFFNPEEGYSNRLKLSDSNFTIIFEVGSYKLFPNEQRELIDILFTLNKLSKQYILCSRVSLENLEENVGGGISDIISTQCKASIIE